jgi:4-amino-4-deoxy-L-arabinose transferase-like glycosyltransferase
MPDVYLFTSLGCALLFFALGLYGPAARRTLHFVLSYLAFSLAILAKGPLVAGAVCFTTLAVHAVANIDLRPLVAPTVRGRFLRYLAAFGAGTAVFAVGSALAYVFGTSPMWWGYEEAQRRSVADARRSLLGALEPVHGQELLLGLFAMSAIAVATWLWRTRAGAGRGRLFAVAACAIAALVSLSGFVQDDERQLLTAGLVGTGAGVALGAWSVLAFLRAPEIGDRVRPWLAPIARQALLFTAVVLIVAGPWHFAILLEQGHGYVTDFLVKHNLNRALDEVNSTGVSDFYLRTLLWGYFPWSAFIPIMLAALIAWSDREVLRRQGFEIFLLISTLVIFVVFTSSVTKFTHYLTPMLVPMAALIGMTVARMTERTAAWARLAWLSAALLFLLPALDLTRKGGIRYLVHTFTVKRWVPEELEPGLWVATLLGITALLLLANVLLRSAIVAGAVLGVTVLFAHHYATEFVPELSRHKSLRGLVESYARYRTPGDRLGFHGDLKHGIFYYTDNKVELLSDTNEFMQFMNPQQRTFAVIERVRYFKLRAPFQSRYPGQDLHIIDDSHFDYNLIANLPVPEAGDRSASAERGIIGR